MGGVATTVIDSRGGGRGQLLPWERRLGRLLSNGVGGAFWGILGLFEGIWRIWGKFGGVLGRFRTILSRWGNLGQKNADFVSGSVDFGAKTADFGG